MTTLTIELDDQKAEELKEISVKNNISISQVISDMMDNEGVEISDELYNELLEIDKNDERYSKEEAFKMMREAL